jgi:hypothetical protein
MAALASTLPSVGTGRFSMSPRRVRSLHTLPICVLPGRGSVFVDGALNPSGTSRGVHFGHVGEGDIHFVGVGVGECPIRPPFRMIVIPRGKWGDADRLSHDHDLRVSHAQFRARQMQSLAIEWAIAKSRDGPGASGSVRSAPRRCGWGGHPRPTTCCQGPNVINELVTHGISSSERHAGGVQPGRGVHEQDPCGSTVGSDPTTEIHSI